jgi:hypothetical protein
MPRRFYLQRRHIIVSVCATSLSIVKDNIHAVLEARKFVARITCSGILPLPIFISVLLQVRCSMCLLKTTRDRPWPCFALLLRHLHPLKSTKHIRSFVSRCIRRPGDYSRLHWNVYVILVATSQLSHLFSLSIQPLKIPAVLSGSL